ncbi:MAG: GNAT family N-acetyltransferase [Candidatus Izimaplasma sp.]|nr:GNAT family N-acetyltransferase [Candidatus Izimaplasma bacterium]
MKQYSENLISDYLVNPCKFSALPLYKEIRQNNDLLVVHNNDFKEELLKGSILHQRFFRIKHNLNDIHIVNIPGFTIKECNINKDTKKVIEIINKSYSNIKFSEDEVNQMVNDKVFDSNLWKFILDENTNEEVALGICQYDQLTSEVVFDWIQVLPEYRGKGIGSMLVTHLLSIAPEGSKFATVSGDIDNQNSPEKLYRKCGFTGTDIWHIIKS